MGIDEDLLLPYGRYVAKVSLSAIGALADRPRARYVVVTAVTPTPMGEGKTTTTIGLGQAMGVIGRQAPQAAVQSAFRWGRPSGSRAGRRVVLPPGGAVGATLNLHLTGDLHAVTAAHNMLAALVDNHLHHGQCPGLDLHEHLVAAGPRRQRPVAAQHCDRARAPGAASPRQDRVRHHRSFRGHGGGRPCPLVGRPAARSRAMVAELDPRPATPVTNRRPPGGAVARCSRPAPAEPAPDPREHAGPGARRPLRQHRPRQLLGGRRPDRHPRGRLLITEAGSGPTWGRSGSSTSSAGFRPRVRRGGGGHHGPGAEGALGGYRLVAGRPLPARLYWRRTLTRSTWRRRIWRSRSATCCSTG